MPQNTFTSTMLFSAAVLLAGCATAPDTKAVKQAVVAPSQAAAIPVVKKDKIPQIWSDHKIVQMSVETCATKGVDILTTLGFSQIVKNGSYVYGNYINNRAAIKCTAVTEHTFVYAVVAGPNVKQVERLRNEIVWKL